MHVTLELNLRRSCVYLIDEIVREAACVDVLKIRGVGWILVGGGDLNDLAHIFARQRRDVVAADPHSLVDNAGFRPCKKECVLHSSSAC